MDTLRDIALAGPLSDYDDLNSDCVYVQREN
jgi:hypothetical protein